MAIDKAKTMDYIIVMLNITHKEDQMKQSQPMTAQEEIDELVSRGELSPVRKYNIFLENKKTGECHFEYSKFLTDEDLANKKTAFKEIYSYLAHQARQIRQLNSRKYRATVVCDGELAIGRDFYEGVKKLDVDALLRAS